ncbi:MAG: hypothetical protein GY822_24515 [Deltaproteobacteria bacterium]|nr:hypothetical protein [Deltaproteobacteria bacterium]
MTTYADAPTVEDVPASAEGAANEDVSEEQDSSEAAAIDDPTAPYAPKGEKRKKRHLQRRAEMLDTAMDLVLAEGIESLTVARLAKN